MDESSCLEAALAYASRGWAVFPCHAPLARGCTCRRPGCTAIGKHPRTTHGCKDATLALQTIREWWMIWPMSNVAIATGQASGLVVLDCDSYAGGDDSLRALTDTYGPLPETVQQITGGGGVQYFFTHPGYTVRNSTSALGDGLDIRGDGGYVIAPPSLHHAGRKYWWDAACHYEDVPLAPLPTWLLTHTATARAPAPDTPPACASHKPPGMDIPPPRPTRTRHPTGPIPEHQRNTTLFKAGCSMRASGSTGESIREFLLELNAAQCRPPLAEAEVRRIASSCERYAPGNGATPHGAYTTTTRGRPTETFQNFCVALTMLHPWRLNCWYDAVRDRSMIGDEPMEPRHVDRAALDIERQVGIPIRTLAMLTRALTQHCRRVSRDPLREMLDRLPPWDGIERLTHWLCDHAGVVSSESTHEAQRLLPVSMIARALEPGCQYRNVIIFEGAENIGKSRLVQLLAGPEWYRDVSSSLEGKEAHMLLKGVWLAELSELASLLRTDPARLKAFITMQSDDYVPKYSNEPVSFPRRAIMVGTVNPEGDEAYLLGQSGNTRFLPMRITERIRLADIAHIRPQLLAEALTYYLDHPVDWWRLSADAEEQAAQAVGERRQQSPYETPSLETWLDKVRAADPAIPYTIPLHWEDVATGCLGLPKDRWSRLVQMHIASALKGYGWTVKNARSRGQHGRFWFPPPATGDHT